MIYKSIKNKTAIITGASEGIGRAIAENLSKNGAKILLISRDEKKLLKLKSYLKKKYSSKVEILAGDVKDTMLSKKIVDKTNNKRFILISILPAMKLIGIKPNKRLK